MQKNLIFSVLLVIAMLFWGSSWPSSKILIRYTSPEIITFWRFFFALIATLPLMLLLKIPLRISRDAFKILIIAALFNCLYSIMFFVGLNYGSAGKGGVLVTTLTPIFTYILSFLYAKFKGNTKKTMQNNEILGLFLGMIAGICLLNLGGLQELFGKFNTFFILCALDWAVLTLICQHIRIHPLAINFYITLLSVLMFSPLLWMERDAFIIFSFDGLFWGMLFIVSVLSTAIGTSIYYMGIAQVGATKASSFPLLVPAFALLTSFLILREIPSLLTLFGGSLAIFATYLINLYRKKS